MKIVELRVPLPVNLEGSNKEVESGNGFEILKNEDYVHDGKVGRYTEKRFHLAKFVYQNCMCIVYRNVPQWLRHILTEKFTVLTEKCWNEYPVTTTRYFNDALTKWEFTVCSNHLPGYDLAENALNLTPEELKRRKVVVMELLDFKKYRSYDASIDVSLVKSQECSLLPLAQDWKSDPSINGIVCYKVIKVDIPHFGLLGSKVENFILGYMQDKLIAYLSSAMCWIDQWYHLPMDRLRVMESECYQLLNEKFRETYCKGVAAVGAVADKGGGVGAYGDGTCRGAGAQPLKILKGSASRRGLEGGAPLNSGEKLGLVIAETSGAASRGSGAEPSKSSKVSNDTLVTSVSGPISDPVPDTTEGTATSGVRVPARANSTTTAAVTSTNGATAPGDAHLFRSATTTSPLHFSDSDEFEDALEEFVSSEETDNDDNVNVADDEDVDASKMPEAVAIVASPSPDEAKSGPIVFTGYLFKLSSGFFSYHWNVRYIVVCGLNFYYFDSRTDLKPKAKLSLKDARIEWIGEYVNRPYVFTLTTSSKYIYYWSADTEASVKRWILLLQAHAGEHQDELVETMSADWYIHSGGGNVQANDANSPLNRNQGDEQIY